MCFAVCVFATSLFAASLSQFSSSNRCPLLLLFLTDSTPLLSASSSPKKLSLFCFVLSVFAATVPLFRLLVDHLLLPPPLFSRSQGLVPLTVTILRFAELRFAG